MTSGNARRRWEIWTCITERAVRGGSSSHRYSMSRSTVTSLPNSTRSAPSTHRCRGPPTGTDSPSFDQAEMGPSTPKFTNSTLARPIAQHRGSQPPQAQRTLRPRRRGMRFFSRWRGSAPVLLRLLLRSRFLLLLRGRGLGSLLLVRFRVGERFDPGGDREVDPRDHPRELLVHQVRVGQQCSAHDSPRFQQGISNVQGAARSYGQSIAGSSSSAASSSSSKGSKSGSENGSMRATMSANSSSTPRTSAGTVDVMGTP